jgi:hypothetical protein
LLIIVAAVAIKWTMRNQNEHETMGLEFETITFGIALFVGTLLLCPSNSDRYFLLVLYLIPLSLAWAYLEMCRVSIVRPFCPLVFVLCVLIQLSRTGLNYFYSQGKTGGQSSTFLMGSQQETSNHFIRTDVLYRHLVARGAKIIYAESLLAWPLEFYDIENHKFAVVNAEELTATVRSNVVRSEGAYAVLYFDGMRRVQPNAFPDFKVAFEDLQFIIMDPVPAVLPRK